MSASPQFAIRSRADLRQTNSQTQPWLWHGFLAPAAVSLWTSQWKAGKTTLASILLSRMKAGGVFCDRPVAPVKVLIVSEESETLWDQRCNHLDLDGHVQWLCRPFVGPPTLHDWHNLFNHLHARRQQFAFDLVMLDPLGDLLPAAAECSAPHMRDALKPIRRLTQAGLAVLLLHHPKKHGHLDGQAARGTGILSAFADILVEMNWYRQGADDDRRRRLTAYSRWTDTPRQLVVELNENHTDYLVHGSFADDAFLEPSEQLRQVLEPALIKQTRDAILQTWPADLAKPAPITLYKWLDRACQASLLRRDGAGAKGDPFRYWLPSLEVKWQQNPATRKEQTELDSLQDLWKNFPLPLR